MLVADPLQLTAQPDQRRALGLLGHLVGCQVANQGIDARADHAEAFAHQILPHRLQLAGLDEDGGGGIKITDERMHPALLAVDDADLIEQAALLLLDLCQVVLLRQKLHPPGIRTHPVRTVRSRIAISQLDGERNGVTDRKVGQGIAIVPVDPLLAPVTQLRCGQGDLLRPALVESVGDESLANAVVVPGPEGKVEIALERREQVSGGRGKIDARRAIWCHLEVVTRAGEGEPVLFADPTKTIGPGFGRHLLHRHRAAVRADVQRLRFAFGRAELGLVHRAIER